jgi:PAS domain S-box-containing protein
MTRVANWTPDRLLFRDLVETSPLLAWITEADGYCIYLSSTWYEVTGTPPRGGEGYGWLNAVHDDDRARVGSVFFTAVQSHSPYGVSYRLLKKDGSFVLTWAHGVPRFESGSFQGYIGVTTTIEQYAEKIESRPPAAHVPVLTQREREVLTLIATGRTSEAVAAQLGITTKTVNVHAQNAVTKLGASNRVSAIVRAYKLNEIQIFPEEAPL